MPESQSVLQNLQVIIHAAVLHNVTHVLSRRAQKTDHTKVLCQTHSTIYKNRLNMASRLTRQLLFI